MVEKEKVDVVLLDILMPRMHGIEVLARLKAMRPELPVIALTAVNEAATATKMMKLGAFDYLTKPFDLEALCAVIASAIGSRRQPAHAGGRQANAGASVLLVGREIPILATLRLLLTPHPTTIAYTVAAAVAWLTTTRPALVMLDDSIDHLRLIDVARVVRRAAPDCALIAGTAGAENASLLAELAAVQPDAVIPKPYVLEELFARVQTLLALKLRGELRVKRFTPYVIKAIAQVCESYSVISLEAASRASGSSRGYLARLFPAEFGMSFWEYVTAVRLEVVKQLLFETDHKLVHIAELVGFSDAPHLSRVFRQRVGQSPGAYRQSIRRIGSGQNLEGQSR